MTRNERSHRQHTRKDDARAGLQKDHIVLIGYHRNGLEMMRLSRTHCSLALYPLALLILAGYVIRSKTALSTLLLRNSICRGRILFLRVRTTPLRPTFTDGWDCAYNELSILNLSEKRVDSKPEQ